jgi:competence protein ComEC
VPATCLVAGLAVIVWAGVFSGASGRLRVTVLDIGQGDAILIETPAGHNILVDGGPSEAAIMQALGRALSPRVRRIDLVVLSHGQDDHVTGLVSVLERYSVGSVLVPPLPGGSASYTAWEAEVAQENVPVRQAAGGWIDLGRGVRLEVLAPPDPPLRGTADDLNSNSIVLRLVYGDLSFLLTGDLSAEGEEALLRTGVDLRSEVLKLGHHGSDGSSTPAFLAAVRPAVAVVSAGASNSFGHPSPSTILRLGATPLLRTDRNGSVRFETDGKRLWADVERASSPAAERRPAR